MTGLYYYEQRYYDPNKRTFLGVDPLAEKFQHQTPFVYANNNPIRYIDFLGLNAEEPVLTDPNIYEIDEVLIVGKPKRNFWQRVKAFFKGGHGETFEGGVSWTSEIGQGTPNTAKHTEDGGNIDLMLAAIKGVKAGSFKRSPLDPAQALFSLGEIVEKMVKVTTDKKIMEETAGNNKEIIDMEVQKRSGVFQKTKRQSNTFFWINGIDTVSFAGSGGFDGDLYYPHDTIEKTTTITEGINTIEINHEKYPSRK